MGEPIDTAKLRELAMAATPGPWASPVRGRYGEVIVENHPEPTEGYGGFLVAESCLPSNASYLAAVSPDVVVALLDRIAALEAERFPLYTLEKGKQPPAVPLTISVGLAEVDEVLDAIDAVIRDDEVDLTDVDTPEKAKAAQLELVAHVRDQLAGVGTRLREAEARAERAERERDSAREEARNLRLGRQELQRMYDAAAEALRATRVT